MGHCLSTCLIRRTALHTLILLEKAFQCNKKNTCDSRHNQSNKGQTSRWDYRALPVSPPRRRYGRIDCSWKRPRNQRNHLHLQFATIPFMQLCFTAWRKTQILQKVFTGFYLRGGKKIQYVRPYVRARRAFVSLIDMYLMLPHPLSIAHIVKQKVWGVNVHSETSLVPFGGHFQPSVTVMKTNGSAGFIEIKPGAVAKDNSSSRVSEWNKNWLQQKFKDHKSENFNKL